MSQSKTPSASIHPIMLPPPITSFTGSDEQLVHELQSWARDHHYALVKASSNKYPYSDQVRTIYLKCDRGGEPKSTNSKNLSAASRKTNCPFEIRTHFSKKSLNWAVKIHNPHHNHDPSLHPAAHSMHRRLSTQQIETLQNLRINGVNTKEAVSYLHQQIPDCLASRDTIYNANNKHRRNILAGRKPIEVLIEYFKQEDFSVTSNSTEDGRLDNFFLVHPKSIELLKNYHHIFVMDCTYKTNSSLWPLFHLVSMTPFGKTFSVCFGFMENETIPSYIWMLQKLSILLQSLNCQPPQCIVTDRELSLLSACQKVFPTTPRILCAWHIDKNITAHCKAYIEYLNEFQQFFWKLVNSP